jgi:hypothetical protein
MASSLKTRNGGGSKSPVLETKSILPNEIIDQPIVLSPAAVEKEELNKFMSEMSLALKAMTAEIQSTRMQTEALDNKIQYVLNATGNNECSQEKELKSSKDDVPSTPAFKNIWETDYNDQPEPANIRSVPNTARRGSIFAHNLDPYTDNEKFLSQSPIMFARTSTVLKETERQQTLTVKAYLFNKERYDELKSQNLEDKAFTLATTVSQQVIRKLINNERVHNTALSQITGFGPNAFYSYPDDVIIDMFALYFKPTSPQKFGELFYSALKDLSLKSEVKGWVFGHKNYHHALFSNLNELLFKMEEVYNLLTKMQRKGDEVLYPKLVWGKKNMPGLWRYFTFLFGAFEESLIHALPEQEETLKAVKTEAEFFALYRKLNDSLAKQSREQEIANERLVLTGTLQEQFPQYSIDGESKGPTVRKWSREDSNSSLKLVSTESTSSAEQEAVRLQDDPVELYFGRSNNPTRSATNNSNTSSSYPKLYKDKPAERVLPCYSWALHKKCPTGSACVWSHEDKVCREYVEKQVSMLSESPYLNSKVREVILAVYPSAASVNAKDNPKSVHFRAPISQNVHGKVVILESDELYDADKEERPLSDAKTMGDY